MPHAAWDEVGGAGCHRVGDAVEVDEAGARRDDVDLVLIVAVEGAVDGGAGRELGDADREALRGAAAARDKGPPGDDALPGLLGDVAVVDHMGTEGISRG